MIMHAYSYSIVNFHRRILGSTVPRFLVGKSLDVGHAMTSLKWTVWRFRTLACVNVGLWPHGTISIHMGKFHKFRSFSRNQISGDWSVAKTSPFFQKEGVCRRIFGHICSSTHHFGENWSGLRVYQLCHGPTGSRHFSAWKWFPRPTGYMKFFNQQIVDLSFSVRNTLCAYRTGVNC